MRAASCAQAQSAELRPRIGVRRRKAAQRAPAAPRGATLRSSLVLDDKFERVGIEGAVEEEALPIRAVHHLQRLPPTKCLSILISVKKEAVEILEVRVSIAHVGKQELSPELTPDGAKL